MPAEVIAQYAMNGAMLGMMYALVAVGFTLFFGVLDVIQFSHGDVVAAGAFAGLAGAAAAGGDRLGRAGHRGAGRAGGALHRPAGQERSAAQRAAGHADGRDRAARVHPALLPGRIAAQAVSRPAARHGLVFWYVPAALRQRDPAGLRRAADRRNASLDHAHPPRPRHPRRGAGRGDRPHHGHRLPQGGAGDVRARIGAGGVRRRDGRALLQRGLLRDGAAPRRDRLRRSRPRRARQPVRRDRGRLLVRGAADHRRGRAPVRQRLQGRLRLRRGHYPNGNPADRPDRRARERAGMRSRAAAVLLAAIATAFAWLLLRAESQGAIAALIALAVLAGFALLRTRLLDAFTRAALRDERLAQWLAFAAVAVLALLLPED